MDSSLSSWDSDDNNATEREDVQLRISDILHCPIPSTNTLSFKVDGIQNFYDDLMDYYEDCWGTNVTDISSIGPNCHICSQTALPNAEIIIINGTRYFVVCENSVPEKKTRCKSRSRFPPMCLLL